MEDGGRLGSHALALLNALAIVVIDKGKRPPFAYRVVGLSAPTLVSLWERLPTWLRLAISKHVTRLLCRDTAARLYRYI